MGCIKVFEDLLRYEAVIAQTRPGVIVECGTFTGHSALWFAQQGVDVITIDIPPDSGIPYTRKSKDTVVEIPEITYLVGSSTDLSIVSQVEELVCDRRTMVVLDSDHSADHVKREIELYGPFVSPGCYLVVEDGILRWLPSDYVGNPLDAIEGSLIYNEAWMRAIAIEEMFSVTLYPFGWWIKR
jgi:cephalosporin hydroxylase